MSAPLPNARGGLKGWHGTNKCVSILISVQYKFHLKCLFLTEHYRMNKSLVMVQARSKKLIILG
ncbi:MAG: hypothetical protein ACOYNU_13525, partial [Bacteroidales bacterium]